VPFIKEFQDLGVGYSTEHALTMDGLRIGWKDLASKMFGLDYYRYHELFMPDATVYGGPLPETATAKQVANHIVRFVRRRRAQEDAR
jgi:hypothetical protein